MNYTLLSSLFNERFLIFYIFRNDPPALEYLSLTQMRFNSEISLSVSGVVSVFSFLLFFFSSFLPSFYSDDSTQRSLSGISEPSIFVCLKNSGRSARGGGEVMAVLPLKCYLNDKVVWLHGLRGVILYTFTRLHRETGAPAFGLHRSRVCGAPRERAPSRDPRPRPTSPVCARVLYIRNDHVLAYTCTSVPVYIIRVFRAHTCDTYVYWVSRAAHYSSYVDPRNSISFK